MVGLSDFFSSDAGQRSLLALGSGLLANSSGPGGLGGGRPSTAQALGRAVPGAVNAYDQTQEMQRKRALQDLQMRQLQGAVEDADQRRSRAAQLRDAVLGTETQMQANPLATGAAGEVQSYLQPGQESILDLNPAQRAAAAGMGNDQLAQLAANRSGLNRNVKQLTGAEAQQLGLPEGSIVQLNQDTGQMQVLREGFDESAYRQKQAINFGYQDRLAANAAGRRQDASQQALEANRALLDSLDLTPAQRAALQLGGADSRDAVFKQVLGGSPAGGQAAPAPAPLDDTALESAFGLWNNALGTAGGALDYVTNGAWGSEYGQENREAEAVVNSINTDLREAMQPVGSRAAVWDRQQANNLLPQPGTTGSATAQKRYRQIAEVYLPRQIQSLQEALQSGELTQSDQGKATTRLIQAQNMQQQLLNYVNNWDGSGSDGQSQAAPATDIPEVGATMDGYTFLGGDPADPNNWREGSAEPLTIDINGGR